MSFYLLKLSAARLSVTSLAESREWYSAFFGTEPAEDLPNFVSFELAAAERLGGKVYRGPLKVEETGTTIAQIRDPFGNVFGLEAES